MIAFHRYLPCLRYDVSRLRTKNIDRDLLAAENALDTKRKEFHKVSREFEATVHEFLEDNDRIKALRK